MKLTLVLVFLAVTAVVVRSEVVAEEEHDADTPIRQAQRAMLQEREVATAAHANEDVLGMRLQAVSEGADRPQPHARRISGAAKSFKANDKMCVMCQFLAQRVQQDLVGGFHGLPYYSGGAYGHYAYGGAGVPPFAMMAGVPSTGAAFVEMADADAESDEDLVEVEDEAEEEVDAADEEEEQSEEEESEDLALLQIEDETEEEATEEEEEESEDEDEAEEEEAEESEEEAEEEEEEETALLEVSGEDEGEWTTPQYTNEQAPAPASALLEVAGEDFQTPQYIDAVYQTVEGEDSEENEESSEESAEEGTADSAEPAFFESSALVAKATEEGEWTTPEYNAESAAPAVEMADAELTAFVQTGDSDESEDAWTTPAYSDSMQAASGAKSYARVIVPAHKEQSFIEAASTQTAAQTTEAQSEVKMIRPRIIRSRRTRTRNGLPVIFHTAKRYRQSDAIVPRPRWNRHDPHTPRRMSQRLIAGMALRNAEHVAYDRLEAYCSTRLPEMYAKYCRPVLRKFRRITEALSYGDRVSHACMAIGLCKRDSYVTQSPHDQLEDRN